MKIVFVIDTIWTGHVPMYHKIFISTLLKLGCKVISISPHPENIKETDAFLYKPIKMNNASGPLKDYERALNWWKSCKKSIEDTGIKPDLVFLLSVEKNVVSTLLTGKKLDEIFPYKWIGLYLTPKYLRKSLIKFAYKSLFRRDRFFSAENNQAISVLDRGLVSRLKNLFPKKKVLVMPDFTFTETGAPSNLLYERFLEKRKGRKVIGLFGEISKRKGIKTFLQGAQIAKVTHPDWLFLIIGPMNESNNDPQSLKELKNAVVNAPDNCFFYLDRIDDEKLFNDFIECCDVLYGAYHKFYHSSNMLTKSAVFKKPIIVSKGYYMEECVNEFGLGTAVNEYAPEEVVSGIEKVLDSQFGGQFDEFAKLNSVDRLEEMFVNLGLGH